MPSIQVLTHALDRRFTTPSRLAAIVGTGGKHAAVDSIIGPKAVAADAAVALANQYLYLDWTRDKIEALLQGRWIYRQRYRYRGPGTNRHELTLPQWPAEREALEVLNLEADSFRLNDPELRFPYRDAGFPSTNRQAAFTGDPIATTEIDNYRVDFTAGYLMPGQIQEWAAARAYITNSSESVGTSPPAFGSWTLPSDPTNKLTFECTTAGTTAGTEPAWPTANPWEPSTVYATGDWALATNGPIGWWFEATTGGTSDAAEPGWPIVGETVVDGSVTWTARAELTFAEGPDNLVWTAHFTEELSVALQEMAALIAIELAKLSAGIECQDDDCAKKFARKLRLAA